MCFALTAASCTESAEEKKAKIEKDDRLCKEIGGRPSVSVSPKDSIWFKDSCWCGTEKWEYLQAVNRGIGLGDSSFGCVRPGSIRHKELLKKCEELEKQ